MRSLPALLTLSLALTTTPRAQLAWNLRAESHVRSHVRMVYDSVRGRLVSFGGTVDGTVDDALLESDGGPFRRVTSSSARPGSRWAHASAFDATHGVTVVHGGLRTISGNANDETWTWNGVSWRREASGPSARFGAAMAFDSLRQRVVLFGGSDAQAQPLDDTWEWDGSHWTQSVPTHRPAARWGHRMLWHAGRGRVVMCGGKTAHPAFDTWEWDGVNWSLRPSTTGPTARYDFALGYDVPRDRVVLHGGGLDRAGLNVESDTWEWDGTSWVQRVTQRRIVVYTHALEDDPGRQRVVMFGVSPPVVPRSTFVYEWDGQDWVVDRQRSAPAPVFGGRMTWDPVHQRVLMLGPPNYGDPGTLWSFAGDSWRLVDEASPVSVLAGFTFDSRRNVAILFGGLIDNAAVSRMYEFDGSRWQRRAETLPSARHGPLLVFDEARGRTLLFGGTPGDGGASALADTWEWDGVRWNRLAPLHVPPPRNQAAACYDRGRARVVMYGGLIGFASPLADTWEWDGTDWLLRDPSSLPGARLAPTMSYDEHRRRCVLVGGASDLRIWEWDGTQWSPRSVPASLVAPARNHSMSEFDPRRGRFVLFGGATDSRQYGDTWELAPVDPARVEPFGSGCPGATHRVEADWLPWLGTRFELVLEGFAPSAATVVWCGTSNTSHAGGPLPLPLGVIGMPGCDLLVAPDFLLVPSGARVAVPLPNDPALAGRALYFQAFAVEPGANPLGVASSHGLAATLGVR